MTDSYLNSWWLHVARPAMTKILLLIVDKFEIWESEFLFDKGGEFIKHRLCPMAYKDDELINIPCNTASRHLSIVAFELCVFVFCLRLEKVLRYKTSKNRSFARKFVTLQQFCRALNDFFTRVNQFLTTFAADLIQMSTNQIKRSTMM